MSKAIARNGIIRAYKSQVGRQARAFILLSGAGAVLAAATTALLAGEVSTDTFAAFTLSKSLLLFVASIFEFGVFFPAARLTALATDDVERRSWLGTILLAYLPIGALYVLTVGLVSFAVDPIFDVDAGQAILITAPLAFAYPFSLVAQSISQGTGRAYLQPLMGGVAAFAFLIGVLAVDLLLGDELSLTVLLAMRGGAFVAAGVLLAIIIKPLFKGLRARWQQIWTETRRWGMDAYFGRLLSVGTYNLDVLMVGALADAQQLASYGLSSAAASMIGLPAAAIGTALYPRMTREGHLDRRPIIFVVIFGLVATIAGTAVASVVIDRYLNPELGEATILLVPLGLAATCGAVTSVLNHYLSARAAGRALRNTSIILTVSNVILNPLLIIPFGAMGAALASLGAMAINLAGYVFYVRALEPMEQSADSNP